MSPFVNLIIFACLGVAMLTLSVMAITTKSLLRSATYLLLVLLSTAGFYLFLNYHFLAAVQVSIYAGGVVILFVFAIFLTTKKDEAIEPYEKKRYAYGALSLLAGIALVAFILLKRQYIYNNNTSMLGDIEIPMQYIGETLMGTGKYQYLLPFEILSVLLLACIIGGLLIGKKDRETKN
ncbi:MAG: NADH-quinone oxidoreductase subunit J [Dysgonamonadaceae bacterium]|jgi:NADH-quinone oxidoreductase subunit J|nr:NADH-quinone oxidoreductase subunit J [Dysgonamonadaceae bacterium]